MERRRKKSTFISTRGNGNLRLGINLATPEGRVRIRNGLLEPRPPLGRRVLVAFDAVESVLGSIEDEVGGVVTKEALAHVYDGLFGGSGGCFVDDGPGWRVSTCCSFLFYSF